MFTPVRIILFLFAVLSLAAVHLTAAPPPDRILSPATSSPDIIDNTTFVNANRVFMFVTNHGSFGRDLNGYFGNDYGTYFPYTTEEDIEFGITNSPLYCGGIWIGGMVNGQPRVTIAEYSSEYVPGPMSGGTYMADRAEFKVYKLYSDSTASNPNADWTNWPTDQGAPADKFDGRIRDGQMLWTVFNDADPLQHTTNNGGTSPLGIEVQQTVFTIADQPFLDNIIMVRYVMYNRGANTINDCYVGIFLDPDLGGSQDDLVGCDTIENLFYCYNADNDDAAYGSTPPVMGAKILRGPLVPSPGDTAMFDRDPVYGYRNLRLETFSSYTNGTDPDNAAQSYNYMRGLDRTGNPYANGTRFMYPGDPVAGTGDLDGTSDDKRMMGSMGPFTFAPGDSQYVLYALVIGQGGDRLGSVSVFQNLAGMLNQSIPTGVDDDPISTLPGAFQLDQNYPNPFNPGTRIEYELPARSEVTVDIFNVLGQRVDHLFEGVQSAGPHSVWWDGKDGSGRDAASGIYFYRVSAGEAVQTRKMVLMK